LQQQEGGALMDAAMMGHNSAGRTRCIFRAHGERGYTKLRNAFLQDRRLSFEARGLIASLLSLPDDWEVTVMSIIASGPAGRDKVYRMIKEAEKYGYIRPEQGRSGGKFDRQLYLVSDDPEALIERVASEILVLESVANLSLTENTEAVKTAENKDIPPLTALPLTEKPLTAKPLTGSPLTANPTRQINKEGNINIYPKDQIVSDEQARSDPPLKVKRSRSAVPDQYPHDFEEFWKIYPRREGKGEACKAWQRLTLPQKRRAYVALKAQIPALEARRRDSRGDYCPHAATWINQGRFDDDVAGERSNPVRQKPAHMPQSVWDKILRDEAQVRGVP
jgi:hypothetical protein